MPIPKGVGRFNRLFVNPLAGLVAGRVPPFALVLHRGRTSGRRYKTPVAAFPTEDGYVIALTYGAGTDWVRNVLKGSGCILLRAGRPVKLSRPEVVSGADAMKLVPVSVRWPLRALNVSEFLRLSRKP